MNKRFLVAPLAALAFFAVALPANAEMASEDIAQLTADIRDPEYRAMAARVGHAILECQSPDPDEMHQIDVHTTELFLRADDLLQHASSRAERLSAQMLMREAGQIFQSLAPPYWC
jgi:hypothetical protein